MKVSRTGKSFLYFLKVSGRMVLENLTWRSSDRPGPVSGFPHQEWQGMRWDGLGVIRVGRQTGWVQIQALPRPAEWPWAHLTCQNSVFPVENENNAYLIGCSRGLNGKMYPEHLILCLAYRQGLPTNLHNSSCDDFQLRQGHPSVSSSKAVI